MVSKMSGVVNGGERCWLLTRRRVVVVVVVVGIVAVVVVDVVVGVDLQCGLVGAAGCRARLLWQQWRWC